MPVYEDGKIKYKYKNLELESGNEPHDYFKVIFYFYNSNRDR